MVGYVMTENRFMWTLAPSELWIDGRLAKELKSDTFSIPCSPCRETGCHQWNLYFYPSGEGFKSQQMSIYLSLASPDIYQGISMKIKLHTRVIQGCQPPLFSSLMDILQSSRIIENQFKPGEKFGYTDFCSNSELGSYGDDQGRTIIVTCEIISVMGCFGDESSSALQAQYKLAKDLKLLFDQQSLFDAVLHVNGGQFPVHRAILAARSPVFERMFTTDMVEKERGVVNITNIDHDTVAAMLEYIYTGTCSSISKMADSLLVAADVYMLTELKSMTVHELTKTLTLQNVTDRLILADLYSEEQLKSNCLDFITRRSMEMVRLDKFKKMSVTHPDLFYEAFVRLSGKAAKANNLLESP